MSIPNYCANKGNTQGTFIPIPATITPHDKIKRDSRFISAIEAQRTFGLLKPQKITHKKQRDEFLVYNQNIKQYGCSYVGNEEWPSGCTVLKSLQLIQQAHYLRIIDLVEKCYV